MQDLRIAYQLALAAIQQGKPSAPALLNELAETIIDCPKPLPDGTHVAAVTATAVFGEALELARPRIESISRLNRGAKFWAGFNV